MKVKLRNRSDSFVGYSIPDMNLFRNFAPYEEKSIEDNEIEKLAYQPGGQELLDSYFIIDNQELANQISPSYSKEPEYKYTAEDLKRIIKTGSTDEFLDLLDFAPPGTIETVKSLCVSMPVTDTNKIDIMKKRYGINLNTIIENSKVEDENNASSNGRTRRVSTDDNSSYKVVRRTNK